MMINDLDLMANCFKRKFEAKTDAQLRQILKNADHFQKAAVKGAERLLAERNYPKSRVTDQALTVL